MRPAAAAALPSVVTAVLLQVGTLVTLHFTLSNDSVRVPGEIVRRVPGSGVAVKFLASNKNEVDDLRKLIEAARSQSRLKKGVNAYLDFAKRLTRT